MPAPRPLCPARIAPLALLLFALPPACRDASARESIVALVPNGSGANGCSGPDQVFLPPQTPSAVALSVLGIGPLSQVTAAGDAELLFATGAGATVVAIDVSGAAPAETELVGPGTVAALLASFGIATAPELSGIAVVDDRSLVVMEHTSNTLLLVDRSVTDTVVLFAGEPNESPGFADGSAQPGVPGFPSARFAFGTASQVAPTGSADARMLVADPGNHAVRMVAGGVVTTVSGAGGAFFRDGNLGSAGFDTPEGLSVTCSGTLLVSELGAAGAGGHRLRRLILGQTTFFGSQGTVVTVAGDGVPATAAGTGQAASLAGPRSPLVTQGGEVYWVDSLTGILRRMDASGFADCPLWSDCDAAAAAGGHFTPGGVVSLTQTPSGQLFVLDADAATLLRVSP